MVDEEYPNAMSTGNEPTVLQFQATPKIREIGTNALTLSCEPASSIVAAAEQTFWKYLYTSRLSGAHSQTKTANMLFLGRPDKCFGVDLKCQECNF